MLRFKSRNFGKCVMIFGVWCVFALVVIRISRVYYINANFEKTMKYDKMLGQAKFFSRENGYLFKFSDASFFNMDCCASVCKEKDAMMYVDESGNVYTDGVQITLFIWPLEDEKRYGLFFYGIGEENVNEQVYVDRDLNYKKYNSDTEYGEYVNGLIKTYEGDIRKLFAEADAKWNLE